MADLLKIGASSLLNLQQAINTTGSNIANVNTPGYSRQSVQFATRPTQDGGAGFVGQGAYVSNIVRATSSFLTSQVQGFSSSQARYQTQHDYLSRIDDILGNTTNSLSTSLQQFFAAVQEVSANPGGLPERQMLIAEGRNLAGRQQSLNQLFDDLNREVNTSLRSSVQQVNSLVDNISQLNREIVSAMNSGTGSLPNDLFDRRDQLVRELSAKVAVSAVTQTDGSVNIFVGRGQALVVGSEVSHLDTRANPYDSGRLEVGIVGQGGSISKLLDGGELQGLIDFRNNNLLPAQTQVGLIALGLGAGFNAQHALGVDLDGNAGGAFFTPLSVAVAGHTLNAGTTAPVVTVNNATAVRASDYRLGWDGATWTLTRTSDGSSVSGAGPLSLDGMVVDVGSGVPQTGDTFNFNPARQAGAAFGVALSDSREIAAANVAGAPGDNRNALALAAMQQDFRINGGQDSLEDYYGSTVALVGISTRSAQSQSAVEGSLLEQAVAYREGISGVNLDEEASNLLRYQQIYQASAQMVRIADDLFQTLIASFR